MDYFVFTTSVTLLLFSMFFTPGPNNTILLAVGLSKGFRAALPHCMAVGFGAPILLLSVGLGLGSIFDMYPILNTILRYVGAAYITWLAWRISGFGASATAKVPDKIAKTLHQHGLDVEAEAGIAAKNVTVTVPMVEETADVTPFQDTAIEDFATQPDTSSANTNATAPAEQDSAIRPLTFVQGLLFQLVNPKGWLAYIAAVSAYAGMDETRPIRLAIMCVIMLLVAMSSSFTWAAGGVFMSRFLHPKTIVKCNYAFALFLLLSVGLLFI